MLSLPKWFVTAYAFCVLCTASRGVALPNYSPLAQPKPPPLLPHQPRSYYRGFPSMPHFILLQCTFSGSMIEFCPREASLGRLTQLSSHTRSTAKQQPLTETHSFPSLSQCSTIHTEKNSAGYVLCILSSCQDLGRV